LGIPLTTPLSRLSTNLADRYTIERELGAGGMATVYLAHDIKHDRKVAIKVLRPELAAVIGAERFLSEIRTTANLQHPHILPLHDSGQADSFLFYVMPFVQGESLRDRLNREKQLPIDDAVRIATEVAGALDYAHRHGVIHRDIKPENILLHDGRALVADFGIALAATSAGSRMTETGMSLGTPHYMSPEQAMGERELTPRSDVYALGAMTYEMLLGEPPFTGPTAQSIVAKVMTEKPAPLTSRRERIPPQVEDAVLTALEKLPADRFASAAEFAAALRNPAFTGRTGRGVRLETSGRAAAWRRVAVVMTVVAIAAVGFAAARTVQGDPTVASPAVVRFTLAGDSTLRFVTHVSAPFGVSPDGRTVAFSAADAAGRIALWVRTLDDPAPRRLQGTDNGTHPAISPDGQWVAYIAGDQTLTKVRLAGGTPKVLAELPGVSASLSWESDDAILAEIIAPAGEILRVSANGGVPAVAVPFDSAAGEVRQRRPLVLRESRMVLYAGTTRNDSAAMVMYSLRDGRRERFAVYGAPLAVISGLLVYSNNGALSAVEINIPEMRLVGDPVRLSQRAAAKITGTAVAVSESGTLVYEDGAGVVSSRLELVYQRGKRTPLGSEGPYAAPRYSSDGRRVAVAIADDIWTIDLATGERTRVTNTGGANVPEWSADDSRLIYVAEAGGQRQVWSTPLDGSTPPAHLVDVGGNVVTAVLTPDDQSVIVSRWTKGDSRLELVRVGLNGASRIDTLVSPSGANDPRPTSPRISPDGRLVAFADRTRRAVHVRSLDGAGKIQISTDGGCCPLWSSDSRRVVFRNADRLVTVELQTSPVLSVANRTSVAGFWAGGTIATPYEDVHYDLSPDGRTFVAVTPISNDLRVFVAFNWGEELRREWQAGGNK
jgi:Tol biopolymer transport system component/tRNA A-37 threonylcarbamoyl transferase component Bud32